MARTKAIPEIQITSDISDIVVVASNLTVIELERLRERYGGLHWHKLKGKATVIDGFGREVLVEMRWYEGRGKGRREFMVTKVLASGQEAGPINEMRGLNDMSGKYVMYIDQGKYLVSLTFHKVYKALPDDSAAAHGWLRILDDTAESWLVATRRFVEVRIPPEAEVSFEWESTP